MMDNMAPFIYLLVAGWVAAIVAVIGMASTRRYLRWSLIGLALFAALFWLLAGFPVTELAI
ncbi:hypothetical protein [Aeromonas enteropelogenes]|uniref:hypothetical protein n=1 Tax=Aeromonas enteropelogenes TaxID=29489 RepID=UPI003BA07E7A